MADGYVRLFSQLTLALNYVRDNPGTRFTVPHHLMDIEADRMVGLLPPVIADGTGRLEL